MFYGRTVSSRFFVGEVLCALPVFSAECRVQSAEFRVCDAIIYYTDFNIVGADNIRPFLILLKPDGRQIAAPTFWYIYKLQFNAECRMLNEELAVCDAIICYTDFNIVGVIHE